MEVVASGNLGIHPVDALEAHFSAQSPRSVLRQLAERAAGDLPGALDLLGLSRALSAEPVRALAREVVRDSAYYSLLDSGLSVVTGETGRGGHVEVECGEVLDVPNDPEAFDTGGVVETLNERFRDRLRRAGASIQGAMLCAAAFKEMIDNSHEHAAAATLPVAGYVVTLDRWAFVVSDVGRGVPDTMRFNPNYAGLSDQDAFQFALQPGISSKGTDRGFGFATVFKALVDRSCRLRFRTATVAAHWEGENPVDSQLDLTSMPARKGFHIEVSASF